MQHFITHLAFLVTILIWPSFALANVTASAESNGATMRILSLPVDGDGKIEALLDIDLQPGWITYWREPGAAGIPPQISPADPATGNIDNIRFPVPKKITLGNYLDIGYDTSVQLPFTIALDEAAQQKPFDISVLIGVCKDVCIPFHHVFTLDPNAEGATFEAAQAFNSALSQLPSAPSDDFKVEAFKIGQDRASVDLELTVPQGVTALDQVIIAGPAGHAYTLVNSLEIDGNRARLNVDAASLPNDYQEAGKRWTLLVTAAQKSMETQLEFPAP